jgi:hypothetical protein
MKKSKVYLKAAKRIANNESLYCCLAIQFAAFHANREGSDFLDYFSEIFQPTVRHFEPWWSNPEETDEDQLARSLALLFMAEIVKGL